MIRTSSKSKIGRYLSYPVTAKVLTEALHSVPQFDQLQVSFHASPVFPGSEFRRLLRENLPYKIVRGCFRRYPIGLSSSQYMIESGGHEEKWSIDVYPVKRELRHLAQQLLIQSGLAKLAEWFSAPRPEPWLMGFHYCSIQFDPTEQQSRILIED